MKILLLAFIVCSNHIREGLTAGSCHYFSQYKLDWFDALFECQSKRLCLANMDSPQAFQEIEKKLTEPRYRDEYWFGLNSYEKYMFTYIADNNAMGYIPPDAVIHFSKPCAFLKPIGATQFTFETGNCGRPRRFVCSAAPKCNGMDTNSTFVPTVSANLPCEIPQDVQKNLGITVTSAK